MKISYISLYIERFNGRLTVEPEQSKPWTIRYSARMHFSGKEIESIGQTPIDAIDRLETALFRDLNGKEAA